MSLLDISPELELATHMSAREIRRELAVQLYVQGKLSAGKARELAEMTVAEFQGLLGSRGIPGNYDVADFEEDLATIRRLSANQ